MRNSKEAVFLQLPSGEGRQKTQWSTIAARTLLFAGAVGLAIESGRHYWEGGTALRSAAWLGVALVAGGALALFSLAGRPALVRRLICELAVLGAVLWTAEFAVTAYDPDRWTDDEPARYVQATRMAAARLGIPFDTRSTSEIVARLRSEGIDALPGIGRSWPDIEAVRSRLPPGFRPLSQASNATIVECNENGQPLIYKTDEYGFNNPPGLVASGNVVIAAVGESLALGHCVPPLRSLVDLIRQQVPGTANFSLSDSGSFSELATLREYVAPLAPPIVLWFLDVGYGRTARESQVPTLARYLDTSFSQGLAQRQSETNSVIHEIAIDLQTSYDESIERELVRAHDQRFSHVLKLRWVRQALETVDDEAPQRREDGSALARKILEIARAEVEGWGGRLLVVLPPSHDEILGDANKHAQRLDALALVNDLGLSAVDGTAVFLSQTHPTESYSMPVAAHPDERGHALLAAAILAKLDRVYGLTFLKRDKPENATCTQIQRTESEPSSGKCLAKR